MIEFVVMVFIWSVVSFLHMMFSLMLASMDMWGIITKPLYECLLILDFEHVW